MSTQIISKCRTYSGNLTGFYLFCRLQNLILFQNFTCMYCRSGFVEDVTIREDSPSSQSDDSGPSWGPLEAAFGIAPEEVIVSNYVSKCS